LVISFVDWSADLRRRQHVCYLLFGHNFPSIVGIIVSEKDSRFIPMGGSCGSLADRTSLYPAAAWQRLPRCGGSNWTPLVLLAKAKPTIYVGAC